MQTRRVVILGSTGSIGRQTLEVIAHTNALAASGQSDVRFEVVGLAAGNNASLLAQQVRTCNVPMVAICGPDGGHSELRNALPGDTGAEELVRSVDADLVVAAMVGAAGIPATIAALQRGCDVALANKETLVAAGSLVLQAISLSKAARRPRLLPVDSEHAGVWQCLAGIYGENACVPPLKLGKRVSRVTLTASGGPFRTWTKDAIFAATPEQALKHPTWTMGGKVTIDSASLMNKCLELIEAYWLFGANPDQLDAVIHPQSIVHATVETLEGSVLMQCAMPDMRTPIQLALLFPGRAGGLPAPMRLTDVGKLTFEAIDTDRFPAMTLWRKCIGEEHCNTTRGAILNAANEVAVARFLDRGKPPIAFGTISRVVEKVLHTQSARTINTLADVLAADAAARDAARSIL